MEETNYTQYRVQPAHMMVEPMPGWREGEKKEQEDCMQFF